MRAAHIFATRRDGVPSNTAHRQEKREFRIPLSHHSYLSGQADAAEGMPRNPQLPAHAKARIAAYHRGYDSILQDDEPEYDPDQRGPCPGHEFEFTGTAYGGDDESYHGEGRVYCTHCGADGDA
jgi:hypothetical protein